MDSSVTGPAAAPLSIAAVERDTGLSKDTLRIWERRYGFPQPLRDAVGERIYPPDQVEKLRLLKRLLDSGHRPGKLAALGIDELLALGGTPMARGTTVELIPGLAALLRAHDVPGLRGLLQQGLMTHGLERFVVEQVVPMNHAVGDAWMRGELTVAQEHLYTEALQLVLRQAIGAMPVPPAGGPLVLMATLPQEAHGVGLLMAEAMLALRGWRCISLGVKVPIDDLVRAAERVEADVVALSFAPSFKPAQALDALVELRRRLPARTRVWAGGSNPALHRRLPTGVEAVTDIALVPRLEEDFRLAAATPPA